MWILWKPFEGIGGFLWERLPSGWIKEKERGFFVHRIAITLAVLFWGMGLVLLYQVINHRENPLIAGNILSRPAYGEGSLETEVEASIEGEEEPWEISLSIQEQKLTSEERNQLFIKCMDEMEKTILGENKSLDEIRDSLNLPVTMEDGLIRVEWTMEPVDLIGDDGTILRDTGEEGELVELTATLYYEESQSQYTLYGRVYPRIKEEREAYLDKVKKALIQADEDGKYTGEILLPGEVDGKRISWSRENQINMAAMTALVVLTALLFYLREEQKRRERLQNRRRQLLLDYPELLLKLSMLIRAGMGLKAAFEKAAGEYEKRKKRQVRYAYEEMVAACHEISSGVSQAQAFENFGLRCQEPCYIKLGAMLSQNLKKGGNNLCQELEEAAATGFEERKNIAGKMAEEAGTKLLLPMGLMLVIVLVIMLVPAVLSF